MSEAPGPPAPGNTFENPFIAYDAKEVLKPAEYGGIAKIHTDHVDRLQGVHDALNNVEGKVKGIVVDEAGMAHAVVKYGRRKYGVATVNTLDEHLDGPQIVQHDVSRQKWRPGRRHLEVDHDDGRTTRYVMRRDRGEKLHVHEKQEGEQLFRRLGSRALKPLLRVSRQSPWGRDDGDQLPTFDIDSAELPPGQTDTETLLKKEILLPEDLSALSDEAFRAVEKRDRGKVHELRGPDGRLFGRSVRIPVDNGGGTTHHAILNERIIPGTDGKKTIDFIFQDARTGGDYIGSSMQVTDLKDEGIGTMVRLIQQPSGEYVPSQNPVDPFWVKVWAQNLASQIH